MIGQIIKKSLSLLLIRSHSGCACDDLAGELDRLDIDYVESNLEYYVDKMVDSAARWRRDNKLIPTPPRFALKALLLFAIARAKSLRDNQT